jgi:hypothetical protein
MEATYSSETSVDFQRSTLRYVRENKTVLFVVLFVVDLVKKSVPQTTRIYSMEC